MIPSSPLPSHVPLENLHLDPTSKAYLKQMVSIAGIRAVLTELALVCEHNAERAAGNMSTGLAKQWAAWCVEIEACAHGRGKLIDPGRQ